MGRVAKKTAESASKAVETSPVQTITSGRAKRTPKPNPKYANDSIILPPKHIEESSESNTPISSDAEGKVADVKVTKSTKKIASSKKEEAISATKATKTPVAKGKAAAGIIKKQKLEYDDDDEEMLKDEEQEKPMPTRSTRSKGTDAKTESPASKGEIKVGDDSVALVDVGSIINKAPTESNTKNLRAPARAASKRAIAEESTKEESVKKKKDDDKPSLISARKSYIPEKPSSDEKSSEESKQDVKVEKPDIKKEESPLTPAKTSTMKTRRTAAVALSTSTTEPDEKKPKIEESPKPLPTAKKDTNTSPADSITPKTVEKSLPTKAVGHVNKPVPRILNSMVTPRVKQSPNVKLAGDGSDKKVFSIVDLTDESSSKDSIVKKSPAASPIKATPVAVKENVSNNKTQPAMLLKNKLESELNRMKASANIYKRQINAHPTARQLMTVHQSPTNLHAGARRITKFESWYVIDVKNLEHAPYRHTHTFSLIQLGNHIKELILPSTKWDYKVTLQRRQSKKENNNDEDSDEMYTGDVTDKSIESEKHLFEPSSILFKRSNRLYNKVSIDRSLMLKQNMYTITMEGKQCKLIGAPSDIKSLEDLEILLKIIDTCNMQHSCVELVTNHDIIHAS